MSNKVAPSAQMSNGQHSQLEQRALIPYPIMHLVKRAGLATKCLFKCWTKLFQRYPQRPRRERYLPLPDTGVSNSLLRSQSSAR